MHSTVNGYMCISFLIKIRAVNQLILFGDEKW